MLSVQVPDSSKGCKGTRERRTFPGVHFALCSSNGALRSCGVAATRITSQIFWLEYSAITSSVTANVNRTYKKVNETETKNESDTMSRNRTAQCRAQGLAFQWFVVLRLGSTRVNSTRVNAFEAWRHIDVPYGAFRVKGLGLHLDVPYGALGSSPASSAGCSSSSACPGAPKVNTRSAKSQYKERQQKSTQGEASVAGLWGHNLGSCHKSASLIKIQNASAGHD